MSSRKGIKLEGRRRKGSGPKIQTLSNALSAMQPVSYVNADDDFTLTSTQPDPLDRLIRKEAYNELSKEAKYVANIVISPPDIDGFTTKRGKIKKGAVRSFLRHEIGWPCKTVDMAFSELTEFVGFLALYS